MKSYYSAVLSGVDSVIENVQTVHIFSNIQYLEVFLTTDRINRRKSNVNVRKEDMGNLCELDIRVDLYCVT